MRSTLNKLIVGRGQAKDTPRQSTLHARWTNFTSIWHNTYEEDAGLEKAVRLFLSLSQFLFPGMYIKHLFWRRGPLYQDFATEVFVLAKTGFPLMVMYAGWEQHPLAYWLAVWFMVETLMYIPTLLFASDLFESPRSYRRSKLLLFLNYQEVVFTFALIHFAGRSFNIPFAHWTDAVYASFMITSTIGFGDYYPVTGMGKLLVSLQSIFYLSYIALFINFFNQGGGRGYFGRLGSASNTDHGPSSPGS
ncbi:MAG: two pore domain potassium channel family protein [Flavobacteriales bacterium]|nr:two pore domain potassium channel family protein [Flavobacteriales bacterium]